MIVQIDIDFFFDAEFIDMIPVRPWHKTFVSLLTHTFAVTGAIAAVLLLLPFTAAAANRRMAYVCVRMVVLGLDEVG